MLVGQGCLAFMLSKTFVAKVWGCLVVLLFQSDSGLLHQISLK